MDFLNISKIKKKSKVGIIGATKGFGYTVLAQLSTVDKVDLRVVNSRNAKECCDVLEEIGYDMDKVVVCANKEEIDQVSDDAIIVLEDYRLVMDCGVTSIVEATGNTEVSADAAVRALERGINVYMVSKETDSICGPYLNKLAVDNDAIYALCNGDQPRNLVDLCSWATILGLEIIVAGKSSEYDFVWNKETKYITYTDGSNKFEYMPDMMNYWSFYGLDSLKGRKELLKDYTNVISADLCEMNLVSNITGLVPAAPYLNYPVARISELANIFIPEEDGGILKQTGVVDVFYQLRETNEASFAGGVFIIVRCKNKSMWDTLAGKGHIVSHNKKYACIYIPYHLMGLETPVSILMGDYMKIGTQEGCRQVSLMTGIANKNLPKGTVLFVQGHHHEIEGLTPQLLEKEKANNAVPFYLLNGAKLLNDIKKGNLITTDDVDLSGLLAYKLYKKGLNKSL